MTDTSPDGKAGFGIQTFSGASADRCGYITQGIEPMVAQLEFLEDPWRCPSETSAQSIHDIPIACDRRCSGAR